MRDFEMLKVEMISSCLCTECQGESVEAGTTSYWSIPQLAQREGQAAVLLLWESCPALMTILESWWEEEGQLGSRWWRTRPRSSWPGSRSSSGSSRQNSLLWQVDTSHLAGCQFTYFYFSFTTEKSRCNCWEATSPWGKQRERERLQVKLCYCRSPPSSRSGGRNRRSSCVRRTRRRRTPGTDWGTRRHRSWRTGTPTTPSRWRSWGRQTGRRWRTQTRHSWLRWSQYCLALNGTGTLILWYEGWWKKMVEMYEHSTSPSRQGGSGGICVLFCLLPSFPQYVTKHNIPFSRTVLKVYNI